MAEIRSIEAAEQKELSELAQEEVLFEKARQVSGWGGG